MPQCKVTVVNGTITIEAGQYTINYIGLAGLGFQKVSTTEWQMVIKFSDWADYRALLANMVACGVDTYNYNPASLFAINCLEHTT